MESVKCTIRFFPEDLQKAYMIHYKKNYPFRSILIPVICTILILIAIFLLLVSERGVTNYGLAWFFIAYALVFLAYYIWKMKTLGKRMFKKIHEFENTFEYEFSDDGVLAKCENLVSSDIKWGYYHDAIIDQDIVLLYPNKFKFNFFHKRYFTEEEFEQLKKWTAGNIPYTRCI